MPGQRFGFELCGVLFAFFNHPFAQRGIGIGPPYDFRQSFLIGRGYIQGRRTSGFLQAGTVGSDGRNSAVQGFQQRDAEAFVEGRVDKGRSTLVECRKVAEGYSVNQTHARLEAFVGQETGDLVGIGSVLAYGNDLVRSVQVAQGPGQQHQVFPAFDASYIEDVFFRQLIAFFHFFFLLLRNGLLEGRVTALIHHVNLFGSDMVERCDVAFGTLADSNNAVGLPAGSPELVVVNHPVDYRIAFRMAQENQVVNRHDAFRMTGFPDVQRQFVAQSVENIDVCLGNVAGDSPYPPERAEPGPETALGKMYGEFSVQGFQQLAFSGGWRIKLIFILRGKVAE